MFPVLLLIVFGALEYGLLFRDGLTGSYVVRAGGRSLSAQGNSSRADQAGLQAIIPAAAAFDGGLAKVSRVVVYFATCADPTAYTNQTTSRCAASAPPISTLAKMAGAGTPCATKTRLTGVDGRCNIYSGTQLSEAFVNDNTKWSCITSGAPSPDRYWCPTTRIASQATGTDYVGIHIEYSHAWLTGLFGTSKDLTDNITFRVEPQGI